MNNFVKDYFNDNSDLKLLVPKKDYDSNPFYGLNQLPSFISPFSDEFLEEIVFLKSFIINYLNQKLNLNRRESHWIYKGLEIFIIDKYIKIIALLKLKNCLLPKNFNLVKKDKVEKVKKIKLPIKINS